MEYLILWTVLIFVYLAWLWIERKTWISSNKEISDRKENGDFTCGIKMTWYGWRVIEYAEEVS